MSFIQILESLLNGLLDIILAIPRLVLWFYELFNANAKAESARPALVLIEEELKTFQGLTSSITNLIIENTGLDRNKLNNEITKIKSFFNNEKLNIQKVDDLLNIKTNEDFDQLKDEALKGNRVKTNKLLAETIFEAEKNFLYLNLGFLYLFH